MKQRKSRILRPALIFVFLPGMICALSTSAAAQDHITPLYVHVGENAPDFALKDGDGKTVRLSDFGGQAVLLDFYRGYW